MSRDWTDRSVWHPVGYGLTALWMLIVVAVTSADPGHRFFNFIFIVPIGGWIVGIAVARLIGRGQSRDRP